MTCANWLSGNTCYALHFPQPFMLPDLHKGNDTDVKCVTTYTLHNAENLIMLTQEAVSTVLAQIRSWASSQQNCVHKHPEHQLVKNGLATDRDVVMLVTQCQCASWSKAYDALVSSAIHDLIVSVCLVISPSETCCLVLLILLQHTQCLKHSLAMSRAPSAETTHLLRWQERQLVVTFFAHSFTGA